MTNTEDAPRTGHSNPTFQFAAEDERDPHRFVACRFGLPVFR